jgi:GT2 family glycosyltransferase
MARGADIGPTSPDASPRPSSEAPGTASGVRRSTARVAVVIVTYNSERHVDACFESLRRVDRSGIELRIIVVDNGSRDRTVARVRERYPEVTVVEAGSNLGFAAGNNVGIERALRDGAEFVYLLNPDTEVTAAFLLEALAVMERLPDAGAVQSLLLLSSHPDRINTAGNVIHFLGFGYCGLYLRPRESAPTEPVAIAFASGAASLFRAAALRAAGLFDAELFLYQEDLDLSWRVRLAGYDILLAPRSVVFHAYDFSRNESKFFLLERNRYLVLLKNAAPRTLLLLAPALLASELGLLAVAAKSGWLPQKLRAIAHLLRPRAWRHITRERPRVAAMRRRSDADIFALYRSDISFEGMDSAFVRRVANPLMALAWRMIRPAIR